MRIKITNCTTTTGGSKIPERLRKNQNVKLCINPDNLNYYKKRNIWVMSCGKYYKKTTSSKIIILKI